MIKFENYFQVQLNDEPAETIFILFADILDYAT